MLQDVRYFSYSKFEELPNSLFDGYTIFRCNCWSPSPKQIFISSSRISHSHIVPNKSQITWGYFQAPDTIWQLTLTLTCLAANMFKISLIFGVTNFPEYIFSSVNISRRRIKLTSKFKLFWKECLINTPPVRSCFQRIRIFLHKRIETYIMNTVPALL